MNNLGLRVVFISISRAEYILVEASFRNNICQRVQTRKRGDEAPIEVIIAEGPWQVVTIDFLSGFVPSVPRGWQGCVVVCDRFSHMMHVKECSTHPTAKKAAALFYSAGDKSARGSEEDYFRSRDIV